MNVNRLIRKVSNVPETRLLYGSGSVWAEIPIDELLGKDMIIGLYKRTCGDSDKERSFAEFYIGIAEEFFFTDDIQGFMAAFVSMLRNPRYRALLCARFWGMERGQKVEQEVTLQYTLKKLRISEQDVYDVADAIGSLDVGSVTGVMCERMIKPYVRRVELCERMAEIRALRESTHKKEEAQPVAEVETVEVDVQQDVPHGSESPVEAEPERIEDVIKNSIGEVKILPNKQKLVEVKTGTNVHYIVVDEGVDILRAPKIYDMVCRDKLHLSFNVTTDRLERCWQIEKLIDEGWRQCEVAELLEVPVGIIHADVMLLRKMGRDIKRIGKNRKGENCNGQQGGNHDE